MRNNTVTGNTCEKDQTGGVFIASGGGGHLQIPIETHYLKVTVTVHDDILWGNAGPTGPSDLVLYSYLLASPMNVTASYSLLATVSNYQSKFGSDHKYDADPQFDSDTDHVYSLKDGSYAIVSGDPSSEQFDGCRLPGKGGKTADLGATGGPDNFSWPSSR